MDKEKPPDPPDSIFLNDLEVGSYVEISEKMYVDNNDPSRKRPSNFLDNDTIHKKANKESSPVITKKPLSVRQYYNSSDKAPYVVHLSLLEDDPSSGTSLHPIKFGQLLMKNGNLNIKMGGLKKSW